MRARLAAVLASPLIYIAAALLASLAVFVVMVPNFGTTKNLAGVGAASASLGVMAVGATLALGSGAIDFSIAGNAAMTGSIAAIVAVNTFPEMGIVVGLLCALLVGVINGIVMIRFRVNAFIATLAMGGALRGISFVVSNSVGVFVESGPLVTLGQGKVGDIPCSVFVFGIVAICGAWTLRATTLGRSMLAVGGDSVAARIAGIRTEAVQFVGYIVSALGAGMAGLLLSGRAGVAVPQAASGTELLVFSAVLLGGTSLNGGRATVLGSVLGILFLNTLYTGLILAKVSPYWQTVIQGALLIGAVRLVQLRSEGRDPLQRLEALVQGLRSDVRRT